MAPRTHKHLTAWLGIIAMCLLVFAPLVSQLLAAAQADAPFAAICSATHPAAADTGHDAPSLSACGYCDLLAHHVAAPAIPPAPLSPLPVVVATLVTAPHPRFTPLGAFPSGRPRGPPAASRITV